MVNTMEGWRTSATAEAEEIEKGCRNCIALTLLCHRVQAVSLAFCIHQAP